MKGPLDPGMYRFTRDDGAVFEMEITKVWTKRSEIVYDVAIQVAPTIDSALLPMKETIKHNTLVNSEHSIFDIERLTVVECGWREW